MGVSLQTTFTRVTVFLLVLEFAGGVAIVTLFTALNIAGDTSNFFFKPNAVDNEDNPLTSDQ